MSGNDRHAGPDGVANDARPSLAEGRRLCDEVRMLPTGHRASGWNLWAVINAHALLEQAEAVAKAGAHHGVEDACLYCDRVRNAAERFRP